MQTLDFSLSDKELISLYQRAKEAYYSGSPLLLDADFDELEVYLETNVNGFSKSVGYLERNLKYKHPSKMLSLAKIQATKEVPIPNDEFQDWVKTCENVLGHSIKALELTPKYDGNSINLIYKNGKLHQALTRGDGNHGRDVTKYLSLIVPNSVPIKEELEVRGELLIETKVFNTSYAKEFKNPRNYVAGIINRDDSDESAIKKLTFIAFEGRTKTEIYGASNIHTLGFDANLFFTISPLEFTPFFVQMVEHRKKSLVNLDGFVLKIGEKEDRKKLGETDHHPKWALAVKFLPVEVSSKVEAITWSIGKAGYIVPILNITPVDIDGSTVSNVSGYNYKNIIEKGLWPGAEVVVAKAGDIIPEVQSIIKPNFNACPLTFCPCGKSTVIENGVHLVCNTDECEETKFQQFVFNIQRVGIERIGEPTAKRLWDGGVKKWYYLLGYSTEDLINTSYFKKGRELEIIIGEIQKVKDKGIDLWKIIACMNYRNLGEIASKQIANLVCDFPYDFSGLEKVVVKGWEKGEEKRNKLEKVLEYIEGKTKIILPSKPKQGESSMTFEMTGHPTTHKVKADFVSWAETKGFTHGKLKDADLLITEAIGSSSSKMQTAKKKGIPIMTYDEFFKKYA